MLGASLRDKVVPSDLAVRLLEAVIEPGDPRVPGGIHHYRMLRLNRYPL